MFNTANTYSAAAVESDYPETPEDYLEAIRQHSRIVNRAVAEYGEVSLKDYLKELQPNLNGSYQDRDDLIGIVHQYAQRLQGDEVASRTAKDFSENPIILTANHHGVDYFSHSFQASLMFSLYRQFSANFLTTVPVFSCGNIPLDNATYPQGLFFYSINPDQLCNLPMKLPVFPNRLRRQLVSSAQPFDREMVTRAEKRLDKMVQEAQIPAILKVAAGQILSQDYCHSSVINQPGYSDQAAILNNLIWKRVFQTESPRTDLIYLELEKIVEKVLQFDLNNENSLIYKVMFEPTLRETVLHELDGARACWNFNQLKKRTRFGQFNEFDKISANGSGTIFFWGINEAGRRIPLYLTSSGDNNGSLLGVDDHNHSWQLTYSPDAILTALSQGRLLPSLFTSFLVLSFARGVRCIGSYFQGEYLPHMQRGLVNALKKIPDHHEIAAQVEKVEANFYLSGMLPVMTLVENDFVVPAGPVEIVAAGGLSAEDIEKMLSTKIRDAHLASLLETLPDFIPWLLTSSDWKSRLTKDSLRRLEGKVVIK
jgi:hypothetical protein